MAQQMPQQHLQLHQHAHNLALQQAWQKGERLLAAWPVLQQQSHIVALQLVLFEAGPVSAVHVEDVGDICLLQTSLPDIAL